MTFGEIKQNIINLGFEESDVFDETPSLFTDALYRARMLIYATVEMGLKTEVKEDTETKKILETVVETSLPKKIDENTAEDEELDIKEELVPLLQLLTAYFVWLDDDERKAVMYYNLYQEQLSLYLNRRSCVEVIGGYDI